jgi:hypothetical protein
VFPAPLMSTIEELVTFLTREGTAARGAKAPASQANGVTALALTGEASRDGG